MAIVINDASFLWQYKQFESEEFPTGKELYYITPAMGLNFFMTLVSKVQELVPIVAEKMNYQKDINVITEYPKDLTKFKAPAIVIRSINDDDDKITTEGKISVIYDAQETPVELDTYSCKVNYYVQFDCVAGTKLDRLMLKSILQQCFVRMQKFPLLDFSSDFRNGVPCKMDEEIRKRGEFTCWNNTHDELQYIAIYRQNFYCKMIIVPYDEFVDLSSQTIKQYTFIDDKPTIETIEDNPQLYTGNLTEIEDI